ncbi:redoxin family protein [Spirillospora sp. NPDC029432]|uniref:TlpA family protein disulfide reductase n=1 Tax=Spirillospora sp. NPDC029432 TaxID=3154599 RepID=UPI0034515C2E
MKRHIATLAVIALSAAACGGGETAAPTTSAAAPASTAPSSTTPANGAKAPAVLKFTGTTLDGKPYDGAALAGKPVVFWFWAPWCPKCQGEGPAVAKGAAKYGSKVAFVGVAGLDKNKEQMDRFVRRTGTTGLVHLDDRDGALYRHFKVTSQSSYVFVSPSGATRKATGPLDESELSRLVDAHTK